MRVKVLISFRDKKHDGIVRMADDEFEASKERYQEIKDYVEVIPEEKKGKKNV